MAAGAPADTWHLPPRGEAAGPAATIAGGSPGITGETSCCNGIGWAGGPCRHTPWKSPAAARLCLKVGRDGKHRRPRCRQVHRHPLQRDPEQRSHCVYCSPLDCSPLDVINFSESACMILSSKYLWYDFKQVDELPCNPITIISFQVSKKFSHICLSFCLCKFP